MTSLMGLFEKNILVLEGEGKQKRYRLIKLASNYGGSSFVYLARLLMDDDDSPGDFVIIKELFPSKLEGIKRITSDTKSGPKKGTVVISKRQQEEMEKYKARARREVKVANELRNDRKRVLKEKNSKDWNDEFAEDAAGLADGKTNSVWFLRYDEPIEDHGTMYTVITTESGQVLSEKIEKGGEFEFIDFDSACVCILRILKALEPVHAHPDGYLHLDIAPDNIFFSSSEVDGSKVGIAKLIDFNSAFSTKFDDFQNWELSKKEGYSPAELYPNPDTKPILPTRKTDLYSVAAIFFRLLIGRPPERKDEWYENKWLQWVSESRCLTGASNRLVKETKAFLWRGLSSSQDDGRFESVGEMRTAIEELKRLNEGYSLRNRPEYPNKYFVCREAELEEIHKKLEKENYVILEGMGGIGKTELVKKYSEKYTERGKEKYDFVQLLTFSGNLQSTIATSLLFHNFDEATNDWYTKEYGNNALSKMYDEKIRLLESYDERTLIIIDSYDPPDLYDEKFDKFVPAKYRVIFMDFTPLGTHD